MVFADPKWLWIGLSLSIALVLTIVASQRRSIRELHRFVAARHAAWLTGSVSLARRRLKGALLVLGMACVAVALARPAWGYRLEPQRSDGLDIVFAVDTSKSMLAEDLRPNRLTRARLAVEHLLERLEGDRVGLVAFAGDAFLQTPLTADRPAIRRSLAELDAQLIPVGGTNLDSAIHVADRAFGEGPENRKVLVMLTDGEELSGSGLSAARAAQEHGVTIFTLGVGTAEGELLSIPNAKGERELVHDENGEPVRSRLDEAGLRAIASATGGAYRALGPSGQGLEQLYTHYLAKLPKQTRESAMKKVFQERFQWPLGLGLALLMAEWLLDDRKRRSVSSPRMALTAGTAALLLSITGTAWADAPKPVDTYNDAAQAYRARNYTRAVESYHRALQTQDLSLQERAYYDLGNAQYRVGQAALSKDRSEAMANYRRAIASYDAALSLDAHDEDARFNRAFVQQKLAELERKEQASKQHEKDSSQQQGAGKDPKPQQSSGNSQTGKSGQPQPGQPDGADAQATQQNDQGQQQGKGQQPDSPGAQEPGPEQRAKEEGAHGQQRQDEGTAKQPRPQDPSGQGADTPQAGQANGEEQSGAQAGSANGEAERERDAQARGEGQLTRSEAEQLLDAAERELVRMPSGANAGFDHRTHQEATGRDW
jgi:Ca-activated chloride channel family protein